MPDVTLERRIELPDAEYQQLMELLDDSPRPAGLALGELLRRRARDITRGREPFLQGPRGMTLIWAETAYQPPKTLTPRYGRGTPSNSYLALGPRAYYRALGDDRVLVWRQLLRPGAEPPFRVSLFDTRALSPVAKKYAVMWRFEAGDMVLWKSGLTAEVDIPLEWSTGSHPLSFPHEFRIADEVLMLGFRSERGRPLTRPVVFAAHPKEDEVQVVILDWWSRKRRWGSLARIVRDPDSRDLVADGLGVKPFRMAADGRFLGWLVPAKPHRSASAPVKATS